MGRGAWRAEVPFIHFDGYWMLLNSRQRKRFDNPPIGRGSDRAPDRAVALAGAAHARRGLARAAPIAVLAPVTRVDARNWA